MISAGKGRLGDAKRDGKEAKRYRCRAWNIEPHTLERTSRGHHDRRECKDGEGDGDVDQEGPAPAQPADEHPAGDCSDREASREQRSVQPQHPGALSFVGEGL